MLLFRRLALAVVGLGAAVLVTACGSSDVDPLHQSSDTSIQRVASSSAASTNDASKKKTASEAPAPPKTQKAPLRVRVYRVEGKTVEDAIFGTGELRADEAVDLRSEEGGRIVSLGFREGKRVDAGDLLVKINDADLVAERRRLEVQHRLAARQEQRSKALLDEQTLSQEVYEEAKGRLQILEAQLEQNQADIARTEIRAPFAGVVGLRQVSEGSYITPTTVVARLQSLDPIKLDFSVPEKYAGAIRPGDDVTFEVSGHDGEFTGEVYAVEPRIDPATRTVQVRARASNPGDRLFPGAFAKVRLVLSESDDALMIPAIALIPGAQGASVFVVSENRIEPRTVTVGRRTEDRVQILSGLETGDQVVISGIQQARPGLEVDVVKGSDP